MGELFSVAGVFYDLQASSASTLTQPYAPSPYSLILLNNRHADVLYSLLRYRYQHLFRDYQRMR